MLSRRDLLAGAAATAAGVNVTLRVPVWTADADTPLDSASLTATVEGRPARVGRILSPSDDLLLLVVLDLVGDLSLVDPARDALAAQVKALPSNAWCGLLRAQDGLRVLVDPGPDRTPVIDALPGLQIAGRAGLLETVEPALELASHVLDKSPVRVAVLYLTDSNIYNYREDYTNPVINYSDSRDLSRRFPEALIHDKTAKLSEALAAWPAPLFIVHLAFLRDRLNESYQTGLQQMAETTGGLEWFCRTPAEIPSTVEQAFARIRRMWTVDVESSGPLSRTFTVSLKSGGELQHRTKYAARKR
jgi:hypothetical protein